MKRLITPLMVMAGLLLLTGIEGQATAAGMLMQGTLGILLLAGGIRIEKRGLK